MEDLRTRMNKFVSGIPSKLRPDHPVDLTPSRAPGRRNEDQGPQNFRSNPSLTNLAGGEGTPIFSEDDLRSERRWVAENARLLSIVDTCSSHPVAVQRNASCCWICEKWVQHQIAFRPDRYVNGVPLDKINTVQVLYSVDGFTRATKLRKQEDIVARSRASLANENRLTELQKRSSLIEEQDFHTMIAITHGGQGQGQGKSRSKSSRQSMSGKVVKWVGVRMLPPTVEPMEVVFIVDGSVAIAPDLPKRRLRSKKVLCVPQEAPKQPAAAAKTTSREDPFLERGSLSGGLGGTSLAVEVEEVNLIFAGVQASEKGHARARAAVCVLDDPEQQGKMAVVPRRNSGPSPTPTSAISHAIALSRSSTASTWIGTMAAWHSL
jgi:hypothetical protein